MFNYQPSTFSKKQRIREYHRWPAISKPMTLMAIEEDFPSAQIVEKTMLSEKKDIYREGSRTAKLVAAWRAIESAKPANERLFYHPYARGVKVMEVIEVIYE